MLNYRGAKTVDVIKVLEGKGTPESPHEEVQYVIGHDAQGAITLGKIVQVPELLKNFI